MPKSLIAKLEHFTRLSVDDKRAIEGMPGKHVKRLGAREDIIREGDRPDHVNLILSGWACRYKVLEDGRRQITAYFVPGDLCDLRIFILRQMDHSIATLSPASIAEIPRNQIIDLTDNYTRIAQALWWSSLVAEATEREWIVSLGQRTAFERLAHLFCELFVRLRCVGLTNGNSCEIPLRQADLAETAGLSTVHVNRVLQELRAEGLIIFRSGQLTIPDLERLQKAALFTPHYLHLDREGREYDANDV